MSKKPYIVVQDNSASGPHVQIRASNGRILFSSEVYTNARNVTRVIQILKDLDDTTPVVWKTDGVVVSEEAMGNL